MSKESVSALIKAIQATTDLFVSKGLTRRQQLVSKTSDDSYVQDLEDVYSSGIDTIVENIPDDPPPTPPTPPVETITGYMWHDSNVTLTANNSDYCYVYESDGTTPKEYDSNKTYTIVHVLTAHDTYEDEYLEQLRLFGQWDTLNLKAKSGTYNSLTFWRIEYTEE